MNIIVFLGPTLPADVARQYLDATYLPPVEQGDVLRVLKHRPDAIGIIDGHFQHVPSVWHKEVLTALAEGVYVAGASSMGALRAAELAQFGMAGIGTVFERFHSGEYTDDDEVAVVHASGEHGYRLQSEAMVNIRDCCSTAKAAGILSAAEAEALVRIAKALHFSERRWETILAQGRGEGLPESIIDRVKAARDLVPRGVKERDAVALLQHLAEMANIPRQQTQTNLCVEETVFLANLKREVLAETLRNPEEAPGTQVNVARKKVLLGLLANREASRRGLLIGSNDIEEMATAFRAGYSLDDENRFSAWRTNYALSEGDFHQAMARFTDVVRVEEACRQEIDAELDCYLRVYSAASENQQAAPVWVQFNLSLGRAARTPQESARMVFRKLLPILKRLRERRRLEQFYFVRKAPDIRLRCQASAPEQYLVPALEAAFVKLQESGDLASAVRSVYEPETLSFGGAEATEAVHEYFYQDSLSWIEWDQMSSTDKTVPVEQLCTAAITDLFQQVLGCGSEVWDAWHKLGELTRGVKPAAFVAATGEESLQSLGRTASLQERRLMKRISAANRMFARHVKAVSERGRLEVGLRSLLATAAMFHCNRFGLDGAKQSCLAARAAAAWNPDRENRSHPMKLRPSATSVSDYGRASRNAGSTDGG